MADGYISQIKLPNEETYDFRDRNLKVYTGSCSTAAGTAIKDVVTDGTFTLEKGTVVFVNFSATNSAAVGNLKLKFNGEVDTNAKPIKYLVNGNDPANIPGASYLRANQTYMFQYDGTNWVVVLNYYTYSNDFANKIGHYNNILARKAIAAESLIVGDETGYEKVASGVTFNLAYPIVWCTGAVNANASNYANMFLQHYDRNIATGAKSGFTSAANKVIYLIVTINGNIATIDSNIITDTLPSSDDGKVYISLGKLGAQSTGANYFFLYPVHPMFWYKNGAIREYSGASQYALTAPLSGISGADDLKAIEGLTGTTGLLKKTAANTWTLDTSTYLTAHRTYTAFTGKPTENQTPSFGGTFTVQQISQNTTGQVSGTDRTITIPSTAASTTTAGLVNTDAQTFAGVKTFNNGIEIKGHIAGDSGTAGHGLYSGGAYHNAYNNIILHGDASTGSSGIAFVSDKVNASTGAITTINQPSDRAFIQYHACGVTTATAEGTAPTLATSGEAGRLVIGIGNDSGDKILLQAPGDTDIVHQKGATGYPIPHTTNTNGSVGGTTTPVYVEAGVIKAGTALGTASQKAESYFVKAITSTDNAIARFDGTSGQIQNSGIIIDDNNNLTIGDNIVRTTFSDGQGDLVLALGYKGGYPVYDDPTFLTGTNSINTYNNSGGGTVTITRDTYNNFNIDSPGTDSSYVLQIKTTGTASPGHGGFIQTITSRANATFIQIFRALVPEGRTISTAANPMGTNVKDQWLTKSVGTGRWEWYIRRVICGSTGSFSNGGHVYISNGTAGTTNEPIIWYLGYSEVYDVTKAQYDGLLTRYADQAIAAKLTTTSNAIAYYTNTTGAFGSKASANGALYATSANGTLQWGTLPLAQGGTGATTAANARTNLGLGTMALETATDYLARSGGQMTGPLTWKDGTALPQASSLSYVLGIDAFASGGTTKWIGIDGLRTSLGLSNALHFIGQATSALADGDTGTPTISGKTYSTKTAGDVILGKDDGREYVWTGSAWEILGQDASTTYDSGAAATNTWVSRIQQASDRTITVTTAALDTSGTWSGTAAKATKANLTTTKNAIAYYTDTVGTFGNASKITVYNDVDITVQNATKKRNGIRLSGTCYGNTATDLTSNTVGVMRYEDGGVRIEFSADSSDNAALLYTNHDSANTGGGSSFHFVGQNGSNNTGGNLAVTAPDFVARRRMAIGSNFTNSSYALHVTGASLFKGNVNIQGNVIWLQNANANQSAAGSYPYITSLRLGDAQYVSLDEYKDDVLSVHGKGGLLLYPNATIAVYDNTKTYAVNDIVWYDRQYYYCKTAIETAEEWTSSHWTAFPVAAGNVWVWGGINPIRNNAYNLGTSSYKWSNVYATTFTGNLTGNATSANYLNLYETRGTTTTLNKAANYVAAGAMFHLVASSSTSATDNGKTPMGDANILQMNWDNNGGYDAQLGIHTTDNRMEFRSRASQKQAWREVVTSTPGTAAGGETQPIYINTSGVATAISYTIAKSVPADAEFTDTTYSAATNGGLSLSGTAFSIASSGVTNAMLAGSIANEKLVNSSLTVGNKSISLGGSGTLKEIQANPQYHVGDTSGCTYVLATINKETSWMLSFTLRLYQGYQATDIQISGYNYGGNHWYSPQAIILGSTSSAKFNVYFGYTGNYKLWVAVDGSSYTGASVVDITNGYTQIDFENAITLTKVSTLPETLQVTKEVYRPWYRNETVSNATTAGNISGILALANLTKGAENTALMGKGTSNTPGYVSVSPSISITAGTADNAPKVNLTVLGVSGTTAQELTKATTGVYGATKLSNAIDSSSEVLAATPKAVKAAYDQATTALNTANNLLATADAMVFKGTLGTGGTITAVPTGASGKEYQAGYTYKIITDGTYAGNVCEAGDLLIAIADSTSGQTAVNNAHWTVVQSNLERYIHYYNNHDNNIDSLITTPYLQTAAANGGNWSGTKPSNSHNGMALFNFQTHSGNYYTQLALDTNQNRLWLRSANNATTFGTWSKIATVADIEALDGNLNSTTPGAGKTLTAFSQTDGKVSATFGNISITKSQVSDFSHTHPWSEITSQPTLTNVSFTAASDNAEYPILIKNSTGNTTTAAGTKFNTGITINPSNQTITANEFIGNLKGNNIIPTMQKTYTGNYYGTGDNYDSTSFFFISLKPDTWYKPWKIKFKIRSYCPAHTECDSVTYGLYTGRLGSYSYANWNERNDSYAHYYTSVRTLNQTGFNAGLSHALGICLRYASNYTNTGWPRTFEVEIYDYEGCTVSLLDAPLLWANWPNAANNYNGWSVPDAVTRGLCETNDATGNNDDRTLQDIMYFRFKSGAAGIGRYTLLMEESTGVYSSLTTTFPSSNTPLTTLTMNTGVKYKLGRIIYFNQGANRAGNTNIGNDNQYFTSYSLIDGRYTFQYTAGALTGYKPFYMVGTLDADGFFTIDPAATAWSQDLPTANTNKVYVFLGTVYPDTNAYRIALELDHPIYTFTNGALKQINPGNITGDASTVGGHTVEADVPSDAVFTDTTYTFDGTYNASSNKAATVSTVTNAINALDGGTIGTGSTTKTITSLSQTNGNVSATFSDIAFPVSSVAGLSGAITGNNLTEALGLSKALRFVGITTTDMTSNTATNHTYTGTPAGISDYTPIVGDVVINSTKQDEWVCTAVSGTTYTWERLGSDTSYKIVQSTVSDPTAASTTSTTFIDTISQDANGVISATKKTLPNYAGSDSAGGSANTVKQTPTTGTYYNWRKLLVGTSNNSSDNFTVSSDTSGSVYQVNTISVKPAEGKLKAAELIGNIVTINNSGDTTDTANLVFSREGWNHITMPNNDNSVLAIGYGTGTNNSRLVIHKTGTVRPGKDNEQFLGSSNYRWKRIYGIDIYGNLTGTASGNLPLTGGRLTGTLSLRPTSGEGGQINISASEENTSQTGIAIDQYNSTLRIFGIASADGTVTGTGTSLIIHPYDATMEGDYRVKFKHIIATKQMIVKSGLVYYNDTTDSANDTKILAKSGMFFSDGIAFANPGLSAANDVGWIRVKGTTENNTELEIATGDDGDNATTGERIVVRQYKSSTSREAVLLEKGTGATTFPVSLSAPQLTLTSTSAVSHITFSRGGWNYITMPENDSSVLSVGFGELGNNTNQRLVIFKTGTVRPGLNGGQDLGDNEHKWNNVYGINFYGSTFSGTANTANQLGKQTITNSNLDKFISDGSFKYSWAGGNNQILSVPTGTDAFGLMTFKTADNWTGQIFVSTNNLPGIYWRNGLTTSSSLVANWTRLANGNANIYYGESTTAAATAIKDVTCLHYHTLNVGDIIVVKFTNANSANEPQLNVNNTGNKLVRASYSGGIVSLSSATQIRDTCIFIYDGTYWIQMSTDCVKQMVTTSSESVWRSVMVSASNNASESFTPDQMFAKTYVAHNVKFQASTGTLRATKFKGTEFKLEYEHADKAYMTWNNTDQSIDFIFV